MFADLLLRLLATPDPTTGRPALSTSAADEVIERSVLLGGTTDTALQELGVLDEASALAALAAAYKLPVADRSALSAYDDDDVVALLRATMPKKLAESHGCCPLRVEGRKLQILCRADADQAGYLAQLEELGFALSVFVQPQLTTEALLALASERVYGTPVPERLQRVLAPTSIDIDFDVDGDGTGGAAIDALLHRPAPTTIVAGDATGWSALDTAATKRPSPSSSWKPAVDDASGWRIPGPGQVVLPPIDTAPSLPKLEVVLDGTLVGEVPEALRQQRLLAELDAKDQERRRRRREKVLWSVDDAISELALGDTRDDLLEVALRFAWRRLQTAAVFVRVGASLTCFDVLDPWLEAHELRRFPLPAEGDNVIAKGMSLMSPSIGPVDESDPLCVLLGRRPRALVVVPILLGDRAIAAIVGDNGDKAIPGTVLAELQMLVPRLGKALGNLVLRARRAATIPSTLPTFVDALPARFAAPDAVTLPPRFALSSPAMTSSPSFLSPSFLSSSSSSSVQPTSPEALTTLPQPAATTVSIADATLDAGPAVPPSPGAKAREALLQATARAWLAHPPDSEIDGLVAVLTGPSVDAARAAIPRIVAAGARALPSLARAFPGPVTSDDSNDAVVRLATSPLFEVLERFGADRVAPIVVFALDHKDRGTRFAAVVACRQLAVPAALQGLSRRLFDLEPRIAALATDALAHSRDQAGYDAMLTRLRDLCRRGDDHERRGAVRALAGLRDVEAISALIDLLPVRPRDLAEEARLALVEITRQDFGVAERRWRAWLADRGAAPRRRWLIEALAHRELPLRRAAADDLADEGVALFGYRADALPGERQEALIRLCGALREPVPS